MSEKELFKGGTDNTSWHSETAESALERLRTDSRGGLSEKEAQSRLRIYGPNRLIEAHKTTWYSIFAHQFTSVLILILVVAAAISVFVGEVIDAIAIIAIVVLNGLLGFAQEWKAEKALEALKKMLAHKCVVVRDGLEKEIDSEKLVPGDIVLIETGDQAPADLRIVEATNLRMDESALTGESVSVHKDIDPVEPSTELPERSPIAWMGATVTNGRGRGVVVATGMDTEFGRIARLTGEVGKEKTPLQKKLATLAKQLGIISVVIAAIVATVGILMEKTLQEMFFTAVSLAVAIVPEGLPVVVTITLALGIRAMVKKRALLRRLQAAEGLGGATVICTDKTGTLTKNEMTAQSVWTPDGEFTLTGAGYDLAGDITKNGERINVDNHPGLRELLLTGLLCNNSRLVRNDTGWQEIGEPTEAALLVAACKGGVERDGNVRIVSEFSFNSSRKRMTVVENRDGINIARVKGAPEVIIRRCSKILHGSDERPLTEPDRESFTRAYLSMADEGLRTLALAKRELAQDVGLNEDLVENDLTLLGVMGIIDPARPEVPAAVRLGHSAGIKIIMITGDAAATARAIAKLIGFKAARVISGAELTGLSDSELDEALDEEALFARVTPEHKLRIIKRLQSKGHIVAMTGDGVNDAPALKRADIGIAMGIRGTDVAKSASDMVLTDDNFASIIGAVEEGRRQYDNVRKFVRYLLSSNVGEVVAVLFNIFLGGPLILLPAQILWINLITDGVTAVALGLEPADRDVMKKKPRDADEPILDRAGFITILLIGSYIGFGALWLFHHTLAQGGQDALLRAQTLAFTGIIIMEKMNVFNFRSLGNPLHVIGFFSNPWVLLAWTSMLLLQIAAVYTPIMQSALHTASLSLYDWGLIFALAAPVFIVVETYKLIKWKKRERERAE